MKQSRDLQAYVPARHSSVTQQFCMVEGLNMRTRGKRIVTASQAAPIVREAALPSELPNTGYTADK